jgi:hypothetical protein
MLFCPPQRQRSFAQRIVAGRAFHMLKHMLERTLTNVQTRKVCEDNELSPVEAYQ